VVTEGNRSELEVAELRLESGTILAIDRDYNDYEWLAEMIQGRGLLRDAHENRQCLHGGGGVRGSGKGQISSGIRSFLCRVRRRPVKIQSGFRFPAAHFLSCIQFVQGTSAIRMTQRSRSLEVTCRNIAAIMSTSLGQ
jgi:hypothetical protein